MLREGVSAESETTYTQLSYYEWKLSGSLNPSVKKFNPYISSFSISSMSSTLLFSERNSRSYNGPSYPPNPGRSFYFPNRFTVFSVSASMAGNPYKTGAQETARDEKGPAPGDALLPDLPVSPWETEDARAESLKVLPDTYTFTPPVLNQKFTIPSSGSFDFSIDYRLAPTTATELQY